MKTRRDFLRSTGLAALALSGCHTGKFTGNSKPGSEKPNIIFILADDLGWSDLGCYGGEIETPNLDRLAQNGVRFTRFYNTAKCFPSRACLLTGLYAQQCGMDKKPESFKNAVTLGHVLRSAGYRTLASGKHHGKQNLVDIGFDRYFGLRDGACNYFNPGLQRPGEPRPGDKHPCDKKRRVWCIEDKTFEPYTPPEKDFYTTDYFTKYATDCLDQYKNEDKPFFLYLAYNAPHDPLQAWPEDIEKYKSTYLYGWESMRKKRYKRQLELGITDEKTAPLSESIYEDWNMLSPEQKNTEIRKMAVYAAMIDRMDQNIGKLLDKLEELGKADNTLIMFASDNGCSAEVPKPKCSSGEIGSMTCWSSLGGNWANASNTPFRYYKTYSHEGGICTPFIAYWPGKIKPGRVSDHPAHFIDIMPTLIEISETRYPKEYKNQPVIPYEGESLLPIFRGEVRKRKKSLFFQWKKGEAVIHDRWKLVKWKDKYELFDIQNDWTETNNLLKENPGKVSELKALHSQWLNHCFEGIE
jgi:arylsulfatase